MSDFHVMPAADFVEHETSEDCVCFPTPRFGDGGTVYVHHSLDGREKDE